MNKDLMGKKVVIIGSGIAGLASAALLAKEGAKVTVIEKNDQIGGRARVYKDKGFTFDMGPSWYLMPDVFEKFYEEFEVKPENFFKLQRLKTHYRIFYDKDEYIDIKPNPEDNKELFESIEPGSYEKFLKLLKISEQNYRLALDKFVYKSYTKLSEFLNPSLLIEGVKINAFGQYEKMIKKYFKNPKLQKIMQYTVVFLGGSPKNTPALFTIMIHVDFNLGVWYPMGGLGEVPKSIHKIGEELGIKYMLNSPVEKIIVENGVSTGVELEGGEVIDADIVISNADYPFTEMKLLEKEYRSYDEDYWKVKDIAPSAFLIYLGVKGKIDKLQHHNLFFADQWEEHFSQIFDKPVWPDNPSYYICAPSKTDPSVAPEGCENIFVLVPIASGLPDTDDIRKIYRDKILSHIESLTDFDIRSNIITERIYAVRDFEMDYNAYKGNALSIAHTLFQSAIFRPKNKSKKVSNLYYTGQYTVPGVGVPMALISAQVVRDRIVSEFKK